MKPLRFALHGPMFSGKSTLARDLRDLCEFTYINYTDYGKAQVAKALSALLGRYVDAEEVIARKNEWRDFIIQSLRIYGFDEANGVDDLLALYAGTPANIVFDNVRYLSQYEALKPYGFTLVRLQVSPQEQADRASRAGMRMSQLVRLREESSEQPLPEQLGEIALRADRPPFVLLRELMGRATAQSLPTAP